MNMLSSSVCSSISDSAPLVTESQYCPDNELADSGTLFADILETLAYETTESVATMSDNSDSEEDEIEDFLLTKQLVKRAESSTSSGGYSHSTGDSCTYTNTRSRSILTDTHNQNRGGQKLGKRSLPHTGSINSSKIAENGSSRNAGCRSRSLLRNDHNKNTDDTKSIEYKEICMNKGAVTARRNRQRKKQYITKLEENLDELQNVNQSLNSKIETQSKQLDLLKNEVQYLRNVIANHTNLSALLRNIPNVPNLKLGSSFSSQLEGIDSLNNNDNDPDLVKVKRDREEDAVSDNRNISVSAVPKGVYIVKATSSQKKQKLESLISCPSSDENPTTGGVCLHVSNQKVSLEFCATCASNAASVASGDHSYVKFP